ncbi:hypothetical protein D9Q98_006821 [Chlorella vulgaris]|uniref:Uncharacterized protein n=1 Tax=Chlorella vulgaris TaxID=3077 RepID=A0A9D4YUJ3_CHLVU|nr:hypothetical protein D9Q98_006821 [Chlorella vulgaris]
MDEDCEPAAAGPNSRGNGRMTPTASLSRHFNDMRAFDLLATPPAAPLPLSATPFTPFGTARGTPCSSASGGYTPLSSGHVAGKYFDRGARVLRAATVRQLHAAYAASGGTALELDGLDFAASAGMIELVGKVVSAEERDCLLQVTINDGTGKITATGWPADPPTGTHRRDV